MTNTACTLTAHQTALRLCEICFLSPCPFLNRFDRVSSAPWPIGDDNQKCDESIEDEECIWELCSTMLAEQILAYVFIYVDPFRKERKRARPCL